MTAALETLWRASAEGAVFGLAVWLLLTLVPATPPRIRVWLWWLVSARLLVALLPVPGIEVPWQHAPAAAVATDAVVGRALSEIAETTSALVAGGARGVLPAAAPAETTAVAVWSVSWRAALPALLVGLYGVALSWQVVRLLGDRRIVHRLARRARQAPAQIVSRASVLADALQVRLPDVRVSREARSPLVTGSRTPVVVLPERAASWPARDLDLALAHELSHVKYRDLRWAWVPALAQRLFFFHPVARLAVREYVLAREAACDARAITLLEATPDDYGRFLLSLGSAPASPLCAAARAPSTFTTLKRRLLMLDRATTHTSRWWWTLVAVASLTLVPLTLSATPDLPGLPRQAGTSGERTQPPPPPPPPPPAPAAPAPPPTSPEPPPPPAAPPRPPAPPAPPPLDQAVVQARLGQAPWVLFDAGDAGRPITAATRDDVAEATRHRQGTEAMVWFRRHGVAYVSRNPQVLDTLRNSFAEVEAIGARLSAIGERQGREGTAVGALGEAQGRLGAELAVRGARIAALTGAMLVVEGERLQTRERQVTREQSARLAEARAELDVVRAEMTALATEQRQHARNLEGDATRMHAEVVKMKVMGQEMRRAVDAATSSARRALDAAIRSGAATPLP